MLEFKSRPELFWDFDCWPLVLHVIDSGCSIEVQFCYVFLNESKPCYEFTNVSELLDFMMMNFPIKISLFCFLSGWIHLS